MMQPEKKPSDPRFCSGPCAKIPGWDLNLLQKAMLGRSHRSKDGQAAIKLMLDKTKQILQIPDSYQVALVPGSATGAITMAMWNFLGSRPVDVLAWDAFGKRWANDLKNLNIPLNIYEAPYGEVSDVSNVSPQNDLLFVWNATSTGSSIGNIDWYVSGEGLTLCDATSAAFCSDLPWEKLDITCFSWQKAMGGEAAHGLIVLSPKALKRLDEYTPNWAVPYMLNLKGSAGIRRDIFEGVAINTPSMLCIEDFMHSLSWAENNGGLSYLLNRTEQNYNVVSDWVNNRPWTRFLIQEERFRSRATSCIQLLKNGAPIGDEQISNITQILAKENVAHDIRGYKGTPSNLRIWTGPTVESSNIKTLLDWLDWVWGEHTLQ